MVEEKAPYLYYFISDVHLGLKGFSPLEREKSFASFLSNLPEESAGIYLLGDIFDFWYEYKYVIPRGFTRTLGALSSLCDRGVNVWFLNGNHDVWTYNYLQNEIGVKMLDEMAIVDIEGCRFCLAHGDELIGDSSHLFLKRVFKSRSLQRLFSAVHPRWAFGLASGWSRHNRLSCGQDFNFRGESDPLYAVASQFEKSNKIDNFIFGHMHTAGNNTTPKGAGFYILGEWLTGCEYLVYNSKSGILSWERGCQPK
ncbi:MAG: UDP-2,3-diacylglucosamine diphosphatase [Bacteroidales bacterium]|jgi:UDP-2,3-diacylglucosamine hydrolase|nr:UDP-2,3-diacylglucosamine diphosphatase [Bacteroidales bacterium]